MELYIDCGGEMKYIGNREWECTKCGTIYGIEGAGHDYDDDEGERLSVWDAAAIWASHGKDEDYMFGYTEDELENAL
ncbi:hypothetical protein B5E84_18415 [Lachnoclostridium sp. An14]|uniref:hypothetical protein n=1 Tax=Lachnoclostridium sp. An14 TaxID=1965562 RepID=UPI000B3A5F3B|nr:hypothetical protein [Lachnoclostridium sp. An14]OUQ12850.1 hypothetical protein B5E84_18415 [Lachnoclostridium sp. An14]